MVSEVIPVFVIPVFVAIFWRMLILHAFTTQLRVFATQDGG